ncbi:hypothetical protein J5N97_024530 [Dioscorea zingiberensis]|uniref:Uncharacterized protein n=1 Tax=Dioscorea zingiberensis TaxID=325984 RepID=A0A9D5C748_9LILI|nr:hypothetical protein J5N97_024530 [Dioscorea zingiberensis]
MLHVINTSMQEPVRAQDVSKTRREKLNIKRSKKESAEKLNIRPVGISRILVLRPRVKNKVVEDRKKDGVATKKSKLWIPPGIGGCIGSAGKL